MMFTKINWPKIRNGIDKSKWSDNFRWMNGNFRWWNARRRLRNAVPAEFSHCMYVIRKFANRFLVVQHGVLITSLSVWRTSHPLSEHLHCGTTTCAVNIPEPFHWARRFLWSASATWRRTDILFCRQRGRQIEWASANWRSSWAVSIIWC